MNPSLAELNQAMKIAVSHNVVAPTLRVNQLDAIILDLELYEMLKIQFFKVFTFFQVRRVAVFAYFTSC